MKSVIEKIGSIPNWYGVAIVLIYALLMAEYLSEINNLCIDYDLKANNIMKIFMGISYVLTIISSVVIWVVLCLMFHLTALLLDGKQIFSKFLFISSYLYVIPAVAMVVAIILLGKIDIGGSGIQVEELVSNSKFNAITNGVNCSFLLFYLFTAFCIHYLYDLRWLYSILSVVIPVVSIWGMTTLFDLL